MKTKRAKVSVRPPSAQTGTPSRARTRGRLVTEADEQARFFALVQWLGPEWARGVTYATLNGVALHPRVAAKVRAQGLVAGIPDIIVDIPAGGRHGLRVELKRRDGGKGMSDEQLAYQAAAQRLGFRVVQCNGSAAAWLEWLEWVDEAARELGWTRPLENVLRAAREEAGNGR